MTDRRKLLDGWTSSKLSKLANYINGRAFRPEEWAKEGIPIIRIENLTDEKAHFNYYQGECEDKYKIVDNDLLVSWSATLDAFIWDRGNAYLNQHIFKVDPFDNIDKKLLYFLLKYSMKTLKENIHGSTMQHITKPKFDNFEVRYPSEFDDQIAIAAELERKMAAVENMRQAALRQKEAISAMHGAVLRQTFPYKPGDKLPVGWRWEKIGNHISDYQSGLARGEKSRMEGYPHLRMNNISRTFQLDLSQLWKIPASEDEVNKYGVAKGDLLFNNTNSAELIGKSCLFGYNGKEEYLFSNHLTRIRTKKTLNPQFLLFWINILWHNRYFQENCDRWVNQAAIRVEESLFPLEIPLPQTVEDQIAIARVLERKTSELEKLRQVASNQLEALEALPGAYLREVFEFADS